MHTYTKPNLSNVLVLQETTQRKLINVNLASQAPLTERTADFILRADQNLDKILPREAFRYYTTALTWMRIIETKRNSYQFLTEEEHQFRRVYTQRKYQVPQPILLFLCSFGTVIALNGEKYDPYFPSLPHSQVGNFGGYYDHNVYDVDNHNLYEEVPALGVVAEACRQSASNAPAGDYQPAISPDSSLRANLNLLGYAPLVYRRQEAKNIFLANGIGGDVFPEDIPNTAINFALIDSVSNVLSMSSAFRMTEVDFPSMPPEGNRCMLLPSTPSDLWNPVGVAYTNANFITYSLFRDTPTTFGVASVMLLQLFKEPRPQGNNPNNAWLGFDYTDDKPAPQAMIDNRNHRRRQQNDPHGLPQRFNERVFSCNSVNARSQRTLFLESLELRQQSQRCRAPFYNKPR
ncbi:unnamed protein product [Rodentolepis nana]|uniref:HEME_HALOPEROXIDASE domain-containing protein n=1 Tax=Rodentolepis nana TaxID=102285 RepID=A0A0R3TX96_RODNA|nr:unnamed protein product [Rodentolepis nana]